MRTKKNLPKCGALHLNWICLTMSGIVSGSKTSIRDLWRTRKIAYLKNWKKWTLTILAKNSKVCLTNFFITLFPSYQFSRHVGMFMFKFNKILEIHLFCRFDHATVEDYKRIRFTAERKACYYGRIGRKNRKGQARTNELEDCNRDFCLLVKPNFFN